MRRFFVSPEQIYDDRVLITGSDAHHLVRVLRLKEGDEVIVLDGSGREYTVRLLTVGEDQIVGQILAISSSTQEAACQVTIVQGIPKGDKMELIIQKTTELGVFRIVPVLTERTVVKLEDSKKQKRQERWQKIAQEASKQCKRATVPEIAEILTLKEYLKTLIGHETGLMLWEGESSLGFKEFLKKQESSKEIIVFIGPEGGFSLEEVELIKKKGISSVTLGQRILRTETAGMTALALIMYELGDLG